MLKISWRIFQTFVLRALCLDLHPAFKMCNYLVLGGLDVNSPIRCITGNGLSILYTATMFVWCCPLLSEAFQLHEVPIACFGSWCLCYCCLIQRSLPETEKLFPDIFFLLNQRLWSCVKALDSFAIERHASWYIWIILDVLCVAIHVDPNHLLKML